MKQIFSHLFLATAAALTVQPILGLFRVEESSSPPAAETPLRRELSGQNSSSEGSTPSDSAQISPSSPLTTTDEELNDSIANLSDEIRQHPRKADAYIERGWEYGQLGQYKMAVADFNKAIKLNPRDTEGYVKRAWMNCNLHRYGKAIADATRALKINPKCADAYDVRAAANSSLGRDEKAIKDGSKSMLLSTKH